MSDLRNVIPYTGPTNLFDIGSVQPDVMYPDGSVPMRVVANSATIPRVSGANRSLTVTTTAQTAMPASTTRVGWKIKNDSATDMWFAFGQAAVATAGGGNVKVPIGGYMASEPWGVETGYMSVIVASGTASISIFEF